MYSKTLRIIAIKIGLLLALTLAPNFGAGELAETCVTDALARLEKLFPAKINDDASFDEIELRYRKLIRNRRYLESSDVDLRRLVNTDDWEKSAGSAASTKRAYGATTARSWIQAMRYVNRNFDKVPLSPNLLKKIHNLALDQIKFHGFEGRRILADYLSGKIDKEEFQKRLFRAYKKNEEVSGINHSSLRGKFRNEAIDEIEHRGSSFKEDGTRYFTKKELDAIRSNPYMRIDESSIKEVSPGVFEGRAFYGSVKEVEKNVSEILKRTEDGLTSTVEPESALRAIIKMEKDLISVHPFLDGNGRSIRLLGDLLRRRHNLPPSMYPNESDLTMTDDEAIEFHRRAMIDYLKAWNQQLESKYGK